MIFECFDHYVTSVYFTFMVSSTGVLHLYDLQFFLCVCSDYKLHICISCSIYLFLYFHNVVHSFCTTCISHFISGTPWSILCLHLTICLQIQINWYCPSSWDNLAPPTHVLKVLHIFNTWLNLYNFFLTWFHMSYRIIIILSLLYYFISDLYFMLFS